MMVPEPEGGAPRRENGRRTNGSGVSIADAAADDASYYAGGSGELSGSKHGSFSSMRARAVLTPDSTKLVLALVGLPGRGKSFIARKISDFLNWQGITCKVFNVGR